MIRNQFRSLSIRKQLISLFCLLIIIPLSIFMGYLSKKTFSVVKDEIIAANAQTIAQVQINIDNHMSTVMQVSAYLSVNTEFYGLIKSQSTAAWEQITETHRLQRMLENAIMTSNIAAVRLYVDSAHMFTRDGKNIFPLSEAVNQPWYEPMVQDTEATRWQETYPVYSLLSNNIPSVSLVRMLRDPNSYNTILGFIVLDIPQMVFEEILAAAEITDQRAICVCNQSGRIISSPTSAKLLAEEQYAAYIRSMSPGETRGVIQDKNGIHLYTKLEHADWYVFSEISIPTAATTMLTSSVGSMLVIVCLVLVLFSAFVFVLVELVAYSIQRKTNKILQRMNDIDADNLVLRPESENHFDVLEDKVNKLVSSVAELMEKSYNEKLRTKDMELRLLQAQINPHFLYNSIDQIYWKAMQHNAPDVAQMLSALAKYFRLSLHKGESIVLIADEIALIKTYLSLQKSRFGMRFSVDVHVQPEAEKYLIPKMSLQPLVENALIHGILDVPERMGMLMIRVQMEGDRIHCMVQDNGSGMKEEVTSRLLLEEQQNRNGSGYGVYSVMKRLQLVFDDDCRFTIHSVEGEGTTVSFAIPLREKE